MCFEKDEPFKLKDTMEQPVKSDLGILTYQIQILILIRMLISDTTMSSLILGHAAVWDSTRLTCVLQILILKYLARGKNMFFHRCHFMFLIYLFKLFLL